MIVQPLYRTDRAFSDPFSAFAVGPYGWVQTAAFVALSLGSFALVVGLQRRAYGSGAWQTGRVLLAAWATGVLLAAIFPFEGDVSAPIHMLASMVSFLAIVAAMFVLSSAFAQDAKWASLGRISSAIAIACAGSLVLATATQHTRWFGVWQRAFLGLIVVWLAVVGVRLARGAS